MALDIQTYADRAREWLKKLGLGKKDGDSPECSVPAVPSPLVKNVLDTASSLSKTLTGGVGSIGEFHFPSEVVGGCCPRVVGQEEDIVWNAAAEICDTERVHVVWN